MKKYIISTYIIIGCVFLNSPLVFSYDFYNSKSELAYNSFFKKLSKKTLEKQSDTITGLHILLLKIQKKDTLTQSQKGLISDLIYLNSRKKLSIDIKIKNLSEIKNEESIANIFNSHSTKISLSKFPIVADFTHVSNNTDHLFLKDNVWYGYVFTKYSYFQDWETITQRDLIHNGIDSNSDLIFLTKEGHLGFSKEYNIVEIAYHKDLKNYINIYDILLALKKDQTKIVSDTKNTITKVQKITQSLTAGKTEEEKIQAIYNYILENISYTENLDLNDRKIFSWIETFNNNNGVCEGYTALFYYMLQFAGITDSKVIYGDVIDSQDFPNIGHAWVQIGNRYYDPTFDDPVGQKQTRELEDYKYYNLPKDLFYTNRYEYATTPESLKTTSLEYRKNLIQENLQNLVIKYKNSDYNLLKPLKFKLQHGYTYNEEITLENFSQIAPIYEVVDYSYNNENGKLYTIKKLNYFPIDTQNNNIETILNQLDYDISQHQMFAWKKEDGTYEYRLWYNLEYY